MVAANNPYPYGPNAFAPNFAPTGIGGPDYAYGGMFNVGGGGEQAQFGLDALGLSQGMELSRQQTGMGLLDYITRTQQDPFSIVPALQQYAAYGGGTMAPANALAGSGGVGNPSPYGAIAQQLIQGLADFTGGTPTNPNTGRPFTPQEMAYLRIIDQRAKPKGQPAPARQAAPAQAKQPSAPSTRQPMSNIGLAPPGGGMQPPARGPATDQNPFIAQLLQNQQRLADAADTVASRYIIGGPVSASGAKPTGKPRIRKGTTSYLADRFGVAA